MSQMSRYRIQQKGSIGGTIVAYRYGALWKSNSDSLNKGFSECTDETGRKTDHALLINHYDGSGIKPLSGHRIKYPGLPHQEDYDATNFGTAWFQTFAASHAGTSMPSESASITTLAARSNPGRPSVSLPNFLYELKDIPGMIREIGRFKLNKKRAIRNSRDFANHQLSIQMGWTPLISDLAKILSLRSSMTRRVNELTRLYSKGGLKRRIQLGSWSGSGESQTLLVSSVDPEIIVRRYSQTTVKRWGTIRWLPTSLPSGFRPTEKGAIEKLAFGVVTGLRGQLGPLRLSVLWEAFPWTWLIDWAGNTGEYLVAHDNTIPSKATSVCLMTESTTTTTFKRMDSLKEYSGATGSATYITKKRTVSGSGSLSAALPLFSGRQLSILGALAIQRLR